VPAQGQTAAATKGSSRSGLGTIVLALAGLAIVGGVIAALVLFVFADKPADIEVRTPEKPAASQPAGTTSPAAPQSATVTPVRNDQVFTFRDVFEPLLKPINKPTASTTTTTSTAIVDTSDYSANTLYLIGIVTEDGVMKAVLVWDQAEMKLAEGQSISGTPWKVLGVRETSVIMLYGDQQVVLTVGQGIQK
jgi:hypothetical protein